MTMDRALPEPLPGRVAVGRAHVDAVSFEDGVRLICSLAERHRPSLVVTPNIQHIALLETHEDFRAAYSSAVLVLPDGWPVAAAMWLLGRRAPRRVTGADLLPVLCAEAARRQLTVGFVGGGRMAAVDTLRAMRARQPALRGHLAAEPPPGFERDPAAVVAVRAQVNEAHPDILFLGLGTPKQEVFAHQHLADVDVGVIVCVGAAIDFAAGRQRRAPRPVRAAGLEWAYRVAREPRRLLGRYVHAAPVFTRVVVRDLLRRRGQRAG